jgi:hypothetical protein
MHSRTLLGIDRHLDGFAAGDDVEHVVVLGNTDK